MNLSTSAGHVTPSPRRLSDTSKPRSSSAGPSVSSTPPPPVAVDMSTRTVESADLARIGLSGTRSPSPVPMSPTLGNVSRHPGSLNETGFAGLPPIPDAAAACQLEDGALHLSSATYDEPSCASAASDLENMTTAHGEVQQSAASDKSTPVNVSSDLSDRPVYLASLFAAVAAADRVEQLEKSETLGEVSACSLAEPRFDLKVELLDANLHAAAGYGDMLRVFGQPDVFELYVQNNSEPGDTSAIEQIKGAAASCNFYLHAAVDLLDEIRGYTEAVQALPSMLGFRSTAAELGQKIDEKMETNIQRHEKFLKWPLGKQLEGVGLTTACAACSPEEALARITQWWKGKLADIKQLTAEIESYYAQVPAEAHEQ